MKNESWSFRCVVAVTKNTMGKELGDVTASMRPQLLGKVRRQAAKVVGTLLKGDADRRASASMKSLIYAPSVVAKKATLALTCQTLKCRSFDLIEEFQFWTHIYIYIFLFLLGFVYILNPV